MAYLILHHDGAYNLYSTVSSGPYYESALTLEQLREVIKKEAVAKAMAELDQRLERAHQFGCSCGHGTTLHDRIRSNRAGPDESRLPVEKFIAQFLSFSAKDSDYGDAKNAKKGKKGKGGADV